MPDKSARAPGSRPHAGQERAGAGVAAACRTRARGRRGRPELAAAIAPLIDEYRLYFRPYVLGSGKPYFAGARPPLRLVATDRVGEDVVRLTCIPG